MPAVQFQFGNRIKIIINNPLAVICSNGERPFHNKVASNPGHQLFIHQISSKSIQPWLNNIHQHFRIYNISRKDNEMCKQSLALLQCATVYRYIYDFIALILICKYHFLIADLTTWSLLSISQYSVLITILLIII